jgi:outer membrane immunogenic protein
MLKSISLTVVVAAGLGVGSVFAADVVAPAAVIIPETAAFDWEGFYVGVHGGGSWALQVDANYGLIGVDVGANFLAAESFLIGIEGSVDLLSGTFGEFVHVYATGRAGVLASDEVYVYALASLGTEINDAGDTFPFYALGGGIEVAVTEAVSVRGELAGGQFFEDADDDLFGSVVARFGVNFHF